MVLVVGVSAVAVAPYVSVFFDGVPLLFVPPTPPPPEWCCMW